MYRCKECKTEYKEKVEYCECGNNTFEEIADDLRIELPAEPEPVVESVENNVSSGVKYVNLFYIVVFILCCAFSLAYVLIGGTEVNRPEKVKKTTEKVVVKDIPNIDAIWDNTPAYAVPVDENLDWNLYSSGLIKALEAKFNLPRFEGDGSCDIEFFLDKHGNLKKKKLYQNSANKPLVYAAKKMLSEVRSYNPPPPDWADTTIKLEFYNDNENYKLRLKE